MRIITSVYICSIQDKIGLQSPQSQSQPVQIQQQEAPSFSKIMDLIILKATSYAPSFWLENNNNLARFKTFSESITDIIIHCVVLFKKSPIPGKKNT